MKKKYCIEYMGGPLDGQTSVPMERWEADFADGIAMSSHRDGKYVKEWRGERLIYRWIATARRERTKSP